MGNLFSSVLSSANTLRVFERQFTTIQNNVANVNTPGYASATQSLEARPMDLENGQIGGVGPGPLLSSRSEFAENAVRTQNSQLGVAEQKAGDLTRIEPLFDLTTDSGVAGALTKFFNSFSQLSVNPNDKVGRQSVLDSAQAASDSFHATASGLAKLGEQADTRIHDLAATVNQLAGKLRDANAVYRNHSEAKTDPGLDATVHATLEQLSEIADISINREEDGTYSVYLGGASPVAIGDRAFAISVDSSRPHTALLDSSGNDISNLLHGGKLAGALEEKNQLIPSYSAQLDTLASSFADQVNQQLGAGLDANGAPPANNLFTYDTAVGAAASLAVTRITTDQIAAAGADAPGGNGNAVKVASMATAKLANGYTFTQYFGQLGARVGSELASAKSDLQTRTDLLDQARNLREQASGVSLDGEAANLLQVQRAYQASGKLLTVLNDMLDSLMQVLR